jgi:membrane protease YdiL (CAAX protease family)
VEILVPNRDKLLGHPIMTSILVIIVYIIFIIIGEVSSVIISLLLEENAILSQIIRFTILLFLNGFVWFWLVPTVMLIPDGKITLDKYVNIIKLDRQSARPFTKNILYALLCTTIFCFGFLIASLLTGEYNFEISRIIGLPDNQGNLKSFAFVFNLIPGIFEEIAYRGVILVLLLRKYSEKVSIIISGIIFGVGHLINTLVSGFSWNTLTQVITGILVGAFFAYLALKSGTLLITIVIHYLYNSFSILFVVFDEFNPMAYFFLKIIFASIIPILINGFLAKHFIKPKFKSQITEEDNLQ